MQRYGYESFGMVTASDPAFENAYTYTGREWDKEIGLYYYRARYYDPMEGRFISKDPIGFSAGSTNLYSYTFDNPTNFADPSGLDPNLQNRTLGGKKAVGHPISHTFIYGTKPDGTLKYTVGWGSEFVNGKGTWSVDWKNDIPAAKQAIADSSVRGNKVGDDVLDYYILDVAREWSADMNHQSKHVNGVIMFNCKTEASNLLDEANSRRNFDDIMMSISPGWSSLAPTIY